MNEAIATAAIAALERQRNSALNNLVNMEAALQVAQDKINLLNQKIAEMSIQPELVINDKAPE